MQDFININLATLNKSFKIEGVSSRREFWYFVLFTWLIDFAAGTFDIFIPGGYLSEIMSILLFVPSVSVAIRRMHDTDHAGWWILAPIVNLVFLLTPTKPSRWAAA